MAPVTPATPRSIADRLRNSDSALSVSELSKLLNVAPLTLLRWVKAKRVPFFRLGRTIRFCPATISRWLQERESVPAWFREAAAEAHRHHWSALRACGECRIHFVPRGLTARRLQVAHCALHITVPEP